MKRIAEPGSSAYSLLMKLGIRLMYSILIGTVTTGCLAGESLVYFGTATSGHSRGIYVSRFDDSTGILSAPELAAEVRNPMFLAVAPAVVFSMPPGKWMRPVENGRER